MPGGDAKVPSIRTAAVVSKFDAEGFARQYTAFSNAIVGSMREISTLADDRSSTYLLVVATVNLMLAFVWKLQIFGVRVSELHPAEFVSLIALSVVLYGGGSYLRLLQYKDQQAVRQEMRTAGLTIMKDAQERAIDVARSAAASGEELYKAAHDVEAQEAGRTTI